MVDLGRGGVSCEGEGAFLVSEVPLCTTALGMCGAPDERITKIRSSTCVLLHMCFKSPGVMSSCVHMFCTCTALARPDRHTLQGYLAHKKLHPPRTLQQDYA